MYPYYVMQILFITYLQAVKIFNSRGFGADACGRLATQMQMYNAGLPPFDLSISQGPFSVKAWWYSLGPAAQDLGTLANYLYSVVPHAASTERTFSIMGWYNSPRRNRLEVGTVAMMTAIKANLQLDVPR